MHRPSRSHLIFWSHVLGAHKTMCIELYSTYYLFISFSHPQDILSEIPLVDDTLSRRRTIEKWSFFHSGLAFNCNWVVNWYFSLSRLLFSATAKKCHKTTLYIAIQPDSPVQRRFHRRMRGGGPIKLKLVGCELNSALSLRELPLLLLLFHSNKKQIKDLRAASEEWNRP